MPRISPGVIQWAMTRSIPSYTDGMMFKSPVKLHVHARIIVQVKHPTAVVRIWILTLVICAAVAAVAFIYVDVPAARYFSQTARLMRPFGDSLGATVILSAESVVVVTVVSMRLVRGHVSRFGATLAIACFTSICAYGINDHVLKILFGVPTPWQVMHGSRHGFNLWSGRANGSFPSGHMVLAGAFAGVFMRLYRISIWPLTALLLLAAVLMLAGDWHFLSDLIAGAFFGVSAGLLAARVSVVGSRDPVRSDA
jgi:hypothetical protein